MLEVGNTPLVKIEEPIYAKLEYFNPFGSIKDRTAYRMLREAEEQSLLKKDVIIIEPTSGNTGIALAYMAREMGYKVEIVIPKKVTRETKEIIRRSGSVILETDDDLCPRVGGGTDQSIALAKSIVRSKPGKYFMPNQYENEANFHAHHETTGPEIWRQSKGKVTHFVAGVGTGGTLTGVGKFLKEKNPNVKIIGVQPEKGHHIQGLRNLEGSLMPKVLERGIEFIDEWIKVSDKDAFQAALELHKKGYLVGPSSGATYFASSEIAENTDRTIVTVFADNSDKYHSLFEALKGGD
ncbi:pyridoxal-5'-phosphate-dependent protein subunit beta [Candidatus Micrarchaeota archaeon RBG_16_36_9]|nr:MAG: pyridoxal-5'-phosphate-dependent protein subunit beta [Candidatus Micrarchaeota archaeon RBG_16_36_9]